MKLLYSILFFFVLTTTKSQIVDKISIGTIDKVYSPTLKEERKIWIYNPANGNNTEHFPVLYLLDAEDYFFATVGIIKQMTGRWPSMIVVGITNTNRSRDLTPTSDNTPNSGGGSQFMRFIEKELMPHIDSLYPTAPYRLFSGHSLGGLTVINTLITNPKLFNAYIAIDPSLTTQLEFNPNLNIDSVFITHFKNISQQLGYSVLPSQSLVNNLGYTCMQLKKWDKAEAFFKMNIKNYPSDANGYDSMGDFYEATGNIVKAIESYTKALTLGNDDDTKRKLENLKKKK